MLYCSDSKPLCSADKQMQLRKYRIRNTDLYLRPGSNNLSRKGKVYEKNPLKCFPEAKNGSCVILKASADQIELLREAGVLKDSWSPRHSSYLPGKAIILKEDIEELKIKIEVE